MVVDANTIATTVTIKVTESKNYVRGIDKRRLTGLHTNNQPCSSQQLGGRGGYNRRPYDRPRQDQRDREQERVQDELGDIEKRLGGLIIRVGDKV